MRPRLLSALMLAAALALPGCRGPRTNAEEPYNLLLISIDSLRADHLGCYGYGRETSPAIDALASDATLFEHAVSQAPWTLPAHASLLTSLYSRTHRADDPRRRVPREAATLASVLRAAGYATHAVVGGTFMQARFGFDRGFDSYDDELARVGHRQSHETVTSPQTHARAVKLLDTSRRPFFLFLHYWDVHYDYIPPAPYDTRFDPDYEGDVSAEQFMKNPAIHAGMSPRDLEHVISLYDGEIAWVDSHIGKLLDELKRLGLYDRTIIALTADHGDEFFEHGEKGHQHSLYQELLHVPLILRVPGSAGGRRVAERVELIDVMPTLLDLLGVPAPATLQGRSLRPLLSGGSWTARPSFAETTKARKSREDPKRSESWCVYDGRYKLILFAEDRYPGELYDLDADPAERHNLFGSVPHEWLMEEYRSWTERTPLGAGSSHEGLDDATLRELRSLGYVGDD